MSDTLSLVVFAICVSIYTTGLSLWGLILLLAEIIGYIALMMFGLSRLATYVLKKVENEEEAYFTLLFCFIAVAGMMADAIQLPGIVGAVLVGLAVNTSARGKPASAKLEFLGKSLFIPIFFIDTGFLINPAVFVQDTISNFPLVTSIIIALLVGKGVAAWLSGRSFGYTADERLTVWALTLPQVAAPLAATLVAHDTLSHDGHRLLDEHTLDAVLVLMLATSILGPVLTERFAPA
jgi:Kef-type K+ transport system membrane component KefB